jgi:hypothetical protein
MLFEDVGSSLGVDLVAASGIYDEDAMLNLTAHRKPQQPSTPLQWLSKATSSLPSVFLPYVGTARMHNNLHHLQ